jgi:glutamate dehydrogenase/leucine dehydrogenase
MLRSSLFSAAVAAAFTTTCSATTYPRCSEVTVDVAVLGGGAAGSYVAAQLTDVYGKNVMVIDTASRLVKTTSLIATSLSRES